MMPEQYKKRVPFGNSPVALIGRMYSQNCAQSIEVVLGDNNIIFELIRYPGEKHWRLVLLDTGGLHGASIRGNELGDGTLSEMKNLVMKEVLLETSA